MIESLTHHLFTVAQFVDKSNLKLPNQLDPATSIGSKIQLVFQVLSILAGAISVLIIALAGFQYVISGGDPGKTAKAKDTILYAVIGLAVSAFSFTIVTFVVTRIF